LLRRWREFSNVVA